MKSYLFFHLFIFLKAILCLADDNCDHDYGGCYIKDILLYITIMYEEVNSMEVKEKWRGV